MTPTTGGNLIDFIMQRLGMGSPDGSVPGGPPPDMGPRAVPPMLQFRDDRTQYMPGQPQLRGTIDPGSTQPGSMGLGPLSMPTQAPPGLQPPQLDAQSQFTRPTDAAPFSAPDLGAAKSPAAMAPMGVPYAAPEPQREASMTQTAGRISDPLEAPFPGEQRRAAPESSFLDNAAQFVSGMRTGGIFTDLAGGYKAVQNRNATREFLTQKGLAPETISAMEADPRIFQPVMADLFSSKTQVINNKLVRSADGKVIADFSDAAVKGPDVKEFTLQDGSKVTGVWNAKAGMHTLPNGQPLPTGASDTSGVPPGVDPKKYRETMAAKMAERTASAQTSLPSTLNMIDDQIKLIDDLSSPTSKDALSRAIGPVNSKFPTVLGSTADVEAKIKQLGGGAFLQAIPQIKGTGPMSNAEGERAMVAINRLQQLSQSDEGYATALKEAKDSLVRLRDVAQREARGDFSPRAQAKLPDGMTPEQAKAEARNALARGKDPTAVRNELGKYGLTLD